MHNNLKYATTVNKISRGRKKHEPLAEEAMKSNKIAFLDTCYLISLANSAYSIKESISRLKERKGAELMVTSQVMDELERICSGKRSENGVHVLERRKLEEIKAEFGSGMLSIETVDNIDDRDRAEAKEALARNSEKNNSRVGEGELSIWVAVKSLQSLFNCIVLSMDSDVKALFGHEKAKSLAEQVFVEA